MEFEDQLLKELQTRYPGVDSKILSRIAKAKAKGIKAAEEVKTVADGITMQQLLEAYGDSRASEAQQTAVSNYEKKHGLKDGKPAEDPNAGEPQQKQDPKPKPSKGTEEVPAWAQQLLADNKAMKEQIEAFKSERTANTRKSKYLEAIKGLPEKVKIRYEKDFARLRFDSDEDFESYLAEIKPDIEAITKDTPAKTNRTPSQPKGAGSEPGGVSPLVAARIKEKSEAAVPSAIQGLPAAAK
ncbi:MAG: hypothetical protein LIP09_00840 [Bacteroidales bacterium]|nr:hypothetical protein [Bacteroidales bacterium]